MENNQAQNTVPRKRGRPKKQAVVPTSEEQRIQSVLEKMVIFGKPMGACKAANVPLSTFYDWRKKGKISNEQLALAEELHKQYASDSWREWALDSIPHHRDDGHGHLQYNADGSPVFEYKRDPKVFLEYCKRVLSGYQETYVPTSRYASHGSRGKHRRTRGRLLYQW